MMSLAFWILSAGIEMIWLTESIKNPKKVITVVPQYVLSNDTGKLINLQTFKKTSIWPSQSIFDNAAKK